MDDTEGMQMFDCEDDLGDIEFGNVLREVDFLLQQLG
jgi:hypothetical protein